MNEPSRKLGRQEMVDMLLQAFPVLEAELKDPLWAGLLHLEMACFARFTQARVDEEDRKGVAACFALARVFLMEGDPDVENAAYVSYLENLKLQDAQVRRAWALAEMPDVLRRAYALVWDP
jgi:hypothetical protein